jgi:chemotaxis protein histidine kinase CheA
MAIEKVVNITVKDNASVADKHVKELDRSLNKLEGSTSGVTGAMKESSLSVLENGGAMGLLNDATGGMAMTVKDAVESFALFSKGSKIATAATALQTWVTNGATVATKALRATLISTGIGAVVVLITALVVAMSNMESSAKKAENAQKLLNDEIERSNQLLTSELSDIDYVTKALILRAETQGKSTKEIQAIESNASKERLAALKNEEARLLKAREDKNKTPEQAKAINDALVKNTSAFNKEIQNQELSRLTDEKNAADKSRDFADKLTEAKRTAAEKELADRKAVNAKLLEEQKAFNLETLKGQQDMNLQKVLQEMQDRLDEKDRKQIAGEEAFAAGDKAQEDLDKRKADEKAADEKEKAEKIERERVLHDTLFKLANGVADSFDALESLGMKKSKTAQVMRKGLALVDIGISTAKAFGSAIEEAKAAGLAAQLAAPMVPGIGVAASIASYASSAAMILGNVAKAKAILSSGNASGGGGSGGDGGRQSAPPQFNIVGQNSNNQLAQSIGKSQNRPVEAFVVSGNMTTAQSLDRNRIATATFNS